MDNTDSVLQRALYNRLVEIFDGPPENEAYVLNPGDVGLIGQLETIDARTASMRPMPGDTTIASHVDHVLYGISLLNRWAAGELNPWSDADWSASWKRTTVTAQQWRTLRDRLRESADAWRRSVSVRKEWDDLAASGSLASAIHTAYHLGAIRQILAATKN